MFFFVLHIIIHIPVVIVLIINKKFGLGIHRTLFVDYKSYLLFKYSITQINLKHYFKLFIKYLFVGLHEFTQIYYVHCLYLVINKIIIKYYISHILKNLQIL